MKRLLSYIIIFSLLSVKIGWGEQISVAVAAHFNQSSFRTETSNAIEQETPYFADNLQLSLSGSGAVSITRRQYAHNSYVAGLLFIGALSLLALFILLLFIKSKERIYLYYFLFLIFSMTGGLINLSTHNWRDGLFYSGTMMARRSLEAVTLFALFAYCVFTLKLLDVKKQEPKLANWITTLAALTSVYGLVYWFIFPFIAPQEILFFMVSRMVILPMSLIAIIWVSYKVQSVFKSYFIIGSGFYFAGAFLAVIRVLVNDLPIHGFYNVNSTTYFQLGIFLEIICFALALSHRIYLLYRSKQLKERRIREQAVYERNLAQAQVLASRMQSNPHFIFNSLNAIKYLIQTRQNKKAIKSLTIYSRFIRSILDTGSNELIGLSEELEIIRNYLLQQSQRFDRDLCYSINVEPLLKPENILLPPMLLLPFVEQAIWEILSGDEKCNKNLIIQVKDIGAKALIIIDSSIKRRENEVLNNLVNVGGVQINNQRLELYNKNHFNKINCYKEEKKDKDDNRLGTTIRVTIENG